MDQRHLPRIDTNMDATGHAHPAQSFSAQKDVTEMVYDLILEVNMDVILRRLPSDDVSSTCGPLMPRVRRSPITAGPVQHLDIVSCWKGLSHPQMLELVTWEGAFKDSLATQLKHCLQHDLTERLHDYSDPMNEALLIPRLLECLRPEQPRTITITMTNLVYHMIAGLYAEDQDNIHHKLAWSLSSGDLPNFVFNFVRTHDCIFYDYGLLWATFNVSPSYNGGLLTVFAEAQWQLPQTTFPTLATRLSHGDMYRITPQFEESGAEATDHDGFFPHKNNVTYSATSASLPLQWDFNQECFHAPIICRPQLGQSQTVDTTLCIKATTPFHAGVRFERISRYNIKLKICEAKQASSDRRRDSVVCDSASHVPECDDHSLWIDPLLQKLYKPRPYSPGLTAHDPGSPWFPSYTKTPQSKTRRQEGYGSQSAMKAPDHRHDPMLNHYPGASSTMHESWSKENYQDLRLHYSNHLRAWAFPSRNEGPASPGKRKASRQIASLPDTHGRFTLDKLEHLDLEADSKRRKFEQAGEADTHMISSPSPLPNEDALHAHLMNVLTGPMGEAQTSPPSNGPCWFQRLDDNRACTMPKSFAAPQLRTKQPTFPWRSTGEPPATSPDSSGDVPATPSAILSQEDIQRNYREFEARVKQKAEEKEYYRAAVPGFDGVVSPTDDNDKAFERVFLEGSEQSDWESDVGIID